MLFKTVQSNIPQIISAVNQYGSCMFHGDGNIYVPEKDGSFKDSDDRKQFSNPKDEEAKYRVCFKRGDTIPYDVEGINQMLMQSRNNEIMESRIPAEVTHVKTIRA